jgi:hypothetical protein
MPFSVGGVMLKHIVMWKLKEKAAGMERPALARELKRRLEALVGVVPQIRTFEVGLNVVEGDTQRDVVLLASFDDRAALEGYSRHPAHQEVAVFIKEIAEERRAVDYEVEG